MDIAVLRWQPEAVEVAPWSAAPDMVSAGYRAAAPAAELRAPTFEVLAKQVDAGTRTISARISSPRGATNVRVHIGAPVTALSVDGRPADVDVLSTADGLWLQYIALPARGIEVEFTVATSGIFTVGIEDWSQGLPTLPGMAIEPRPLDMMPAAYDLTDTTLVRKSYLVE
jgi:hypothetical protein